MLHQGHVDFRTEILWRYRRRYTLLFAEVARPPTSVVALLRTAHDATAQTVETGLNLRLGLLWFFLLLGSRPLEAEATLDRFHLGRVRLHLVALDHLVALAKSATAQQSAPAGPASGGLLFRFAVDRRAGHQLTGFVPAAAGTATQRLPAGFLRSGRRGLRFRRGRFRPPTATAAVQPLPTGWSGLGVHFRFRMGIVGAAFLAPAPATAGTTAEAALKRKARLGPAWPTAGTTFRFSSLVKFVTVILLALMSLHHHRVGVGT